MHLWLCVQALIAYVCVYAVARLICRRRTQVLELQDVWFNAIVAGNKYIEGRQKAKYASYYGLATIMRSSDKLTQTVFVWRFRTMGFIDYVLQYHAWAMPGKTANETKDAYLNITDREGAAAFSVLEPTHAIVIITLNTGLQIMTMITIVVATVASAVACANLSGCVRLVLCTRHT